MPHLFPPPLSGQIRVSRAVETALFLPDLLGLRLFAEIQPIASRHMRYISDPPSPSSTPSVQVPACLPAHGSDERRGAILAVEDANQSKAARTCEAIRVRKCLPPVWLLPVSSPICGGGGGGGRAGGWWSGRGCKHGLQDKYFLLSRTDKTTQSHQRLGAARSAMGLG